MSNKLTGMQCMNLERYSALKREIRMFERERLQDDVMDYYRYNELYRLLYILQAILTKEELI